MTAATKDGDEYIRNAGIALPCAKTFGWLTDLHRCDRPYGHTGPHTAVDVLISGDRNAEDEERTRFVLAQIFKDGGVA